MHQVNHVNKINKNIDNNISEKSNSVNISSVGNNNFNRLQHPIINTNIEQLLISRIASNQNEKIKNVQSIRQPDSFTNDFKENKNLVENATLGKNSVHIESVDAINNSFFNINLSDTGSRAEEIISSLSNSTKKKATNKILMHRFYYGLILGTELNSIENQDMKKAGFNIGLMGGYRFTKHISVETGVLFSQKYYTTAGQYFSLKEIGPMMPAAMKVMDVKGASILVEIPLHVRYDVLAKKDHRFFSSAGISSYILTKESNQYHTSLNGTEAMMYATYKKNRGYFAASLDLAIGYEKNIGKKSSIRIQPYIQVPIKGIGVGSLKVMSPGVHIAYRRCRCYHLQL